MKPRQIHRGTGISGVIRIPEREASMKPRQIHRGTPECGKTFKPKHPRASMKPRQIHRGTPANEAAVGKLYMLQ